MEQESNMGDLFREAFKDFERKPSAKVWNGIENGIKPPNVRKFNFFKPINIILGSAVIVAVSIILYFILSIEPPKYVQLVTNNQTVTNIKEPVIIKEQDIVTSLTKTSNNREKKTDLINKNFNNGLQKNISKKQNINDLIAQIDKDRILSENTTKENNIVNTIVVPKVNNPVVNQKNIDTQQFEKNNVIIPKNNPVAEITFSPDQTICKGDKIKLIVNGGVSYLWSTGEKTQYIIVSPNSSIDYSVIVTDENENRKVGLISVTVSDCNAPFIPTAFSPNGDGQSDVFKVYGNNITKFEIIIVSRLGQVVYTSKNVNEGWDGNIKGSQAAEGVYAYTVKYTNELNKEQIITGHVTLIRR